MWGWVANGIDTMSVAFALFFPLIIDFGLLSIGSLTQEEATEKPIIQYPNPLYLESLDYVLPVFTCSKIWKWANHALPFEFSALMLSCPPLKQQQ